MYERLHEVVILVFKAASLFSIVFNVSLAYESDTGNADKVSLLAKVEIDTTGCWTCPSDRLASLWPLGPGTGNTLWSSDGDWGEREGEDGKGRREEEKGGEEWRREDRTGEQKGEGRDKQ